MAKRKKTRKPVTRRIKKALRGYRNLKKLIHDPVVREVWGEKKTVQQYAASIPFSAFAQRTSDKFIPSNRKLPKHKEVIMRELIKKHGTDYLNMERDISVNIWQWTAAVCKSYSSLLDSSFDANH